MFPHIFNKKAQNVFVSFLEELQVKHTRLFSNRYYEEHPYKNTLYGLSCMLSNYHIENESLHVKEKQTALPELTPPFIAHVSNGFVTVNQIFPKKVKYTFEGKVVIVSVDEFIKIWSGIILYADPDADSIEPNYETNKKHEIMTRAGKVLLASIFLLLLGLSFYSSQIWQYWNRVVFLALNIVGVYICHLLLLKQMHIQSNSADKVCSLFFKKSDCNSVLESEASKLGEAVSWSEIGLSYFVANILILAFLPQLYSFVVWINIAGLPFTIWSVWYQKFKAKQWCPLCLIVQLILWLLFLTNMLPGTVPPLQFSILNFLWTGCMYILPLIVLKEFLPYVSDAKEKRKATQELNSLKANEEVFKTLLKNERKYVVCKSDSSIFWGNPDAKNTITIVTNPYCNPCAQMHEQIKLLMENAYNNFCLQFIITTFEKDQECMSKLIIAAYQQMTPTNFISFLNDWYHWGRFDKTGFLRKYCFNEANDSVVAEFQKHKDWIDKANVNSTPTVLFSGYKLPLDKYRLSDLVLLKNVSIS